MTAFECHESTEKTVHKSSCYDCSSVCVVQGYGKTAHSVVLDYAVNVLQLNTEDQMLGYGELGNFSVAGFEM